MVWAVRAADGRNKQERSEGSRDACGTNNVGRRRRGRLRVIDGRRHGCGNDDVTGARHVWPHAFANQVEVAHGQAILCLHGRANGDDAEHGLRQRVHVEEDARRAKRARVIEGSRAHFKRQRCARQHAAHAVGFCNPSPLRCGARPTVPHHLLAHLHVRRQRCRPQIHHRVSTAPHNDLSNLALVPQQRIHHQIRSSRHGTRHHQRTHIHSRYPRQIERSALCVHRPSVQICHSQRVARRPCDFFVRFKTKQKERKRKGRGRRMRKDGRKVVYVEGRRRRRGKSGRKG